MTFASAPTVASRHTLHGVRTAAVRALAVLFGILSFLAVASMTWPWGKGMDCASSNQAYEIGKMVELYKIAHGRYPRSLRALVLSPRPIMEALPLDPWGNEYAYVIPGEMNPATFDVRSAGEDGVLFTDDDIGNWRRK